MTETYEEQREKALKDRSKFTGTELETVGVSSNKALGGGRTDNSTYEFKQFPFPTNPKIRTKKTVDLRLVDPSVGGV